MNVRTHCLRLGRGIIALLLVLCFALVAATPAGAAVMPDFEVKPWQQNETPFATVTGLRAPLYAGPGLGFWTLGGLRQNLVVPILGVTADRQFWYVETRIGKGYVHAPDVAVSNVEGVPVIDPGPIGTITTGLANIRSGPGIGAAQVARLPRGAQFFLIGRQPDGSWLQIRYRFGTGWVATSLTSLAETEIVAEIPATTEGPRAIVNASTLNVRSGPGMQYTAIGSLHGGQEVPILGRTQDGVWLLVRTDFGEGWINVIYVLTRDYFGNAPIVDPGASETPPEFGGITRTSSNIRSGPNIGFPALGSVRGGTQLVILGQSPDRAWWYVDSPFGKGWINKSLVRTFGDLSGLPIID